MPIYLRTAVCSSTIALWWVSNIIIMYWRSLYIHVLSPLYVDPFKSKNNSKVTLDIWQCLLLSIVNSLAVSCISVNYPLSRSIHKNCESFKKGNKVCTITFYIATLEMY